MDEWMLCWIQLLGLHLNSQDQLYPGQYLSEIDCFVDGAPIEDEME